METKLSNVLAVDFYEQTMLSSCLISTYSSDVDDDWGEADRPTCITAL